MPLSAIAGAEAADTLPWPRRCKNASSIGYCSAKTTAKHATSSEMRAPAGNPCSGGWGWSCCDRICVGATGDGEDMRPWLVVGGWWLLVIGRWLVDGGSRWGGRGRLGETPPFGPSARVTHGDGRKIKIRLDKCVYLTC